MNDAQSSSTLPKILLGLALLAWILSIWIAPSRAGDSLSLSQYLEQVESGNVAIQSSKDASRGAELRSSEATLLYSPQLLINADFSNDHRLNPMFQTAYNKVRNDSYTLGIQQLTPFGLKGGVYYTLLREHYIGATNGNVFFEGRPHLEVSLSLIRNGLGSETRAQHAMLESNARATQYGESFKVKAARSEAEAAYIQLASARLLKKVDQASYDRAKEILDWASRRFKTNLGEDSDLYQAQANLEAKKLQLQSSADRERSAARNFNRLREKDDDTVEENVTLPELAQVPTRAQVRDDVRAAQEGAKMAAAQATLGREKNKSTLELYASYARNSRSNTWNSAASDGFGSDRPTTAWGIRFQTPILIGSQMNATEGYGLEKSAAERLVDQKVFDQEVEWKDLTLKLSEAQKRYEIAQSIFEFQKKKALNERSRLKRGRSTTYQTLIFDQDYNFAEAAKIQAQSEVLLIAAKLKTFN